MAELPIANLAALLANINRDPKKGKPFSASDFLIFQEKEHTKPVLSAEVAAVALQLRHEGTAPPILLAAWQQVLASAQESAKVPSIRALKSDDGRVWVFCPTWEGGRNIRGGLVTVTANAAGCVVLRDIDRNLATYKVQVPKRPLCGWLEAGLLLVGSED